MKKILRSHFNTYIYYVLSFILPFLALFFIYLTQDIYWGSSISPLLGDGFHQYVIFDIALRNILHGEGSLFYTFTSGLGLNFYALSSYYLGSFFSPLVYFFDLRHMPDAVYLFTMCKFGLTGLTSFYSLKTIYRKIPLFLVLALSSSYALMSFATSQLEIATWQDVFILIPFILLGFHQLITQKKRGLYFVSLSLLFIQNYYFGYMTALFLLLWYLLYLSWEPKRRIRRLFDFLCVSFLSTLTSMVMLLPTVLDLKTHGEKFSKVEALFSPDAWYLDLFAKNFIGSFDTTKYGSIPMIYIGLFPLFFALIFFTLKSISFHVKLTYLLVVGILVASFYLQPLDLFWQGMHAPNMFLHRYSWLFSILILFMAAETLNRLEELKLWNILMAFVFLAIGFSTTLIFYKQYDFLNAANYSLTLEFLMAYLLICSTYVKKVISKRLFTLSISCFLLFEVSLNAFYQVEGISKEWVFATRSSYEKNLTDIDKLVQETKNDAHSFYRAEFLEPQTGNDTMKYNLNGISQFSSVRNTVTSSVLDKLGFYSAGTNLNLRYQNNSILMDSIFAIKYNLSKSNPLKYGFYLRNTSGQMELFQNQNASGLAIMTDGIYRDVQFDNLTLDNQTKFLNRLAGLQLKYYYRLTPTSTENVMDERERQIVTTKEEETSATAHYSLTIPAHYQVYLTLPGLQFSDEDHKEVEVTINGATRRYATNNVFAFFNLGDYLQEENLTIDLSFPENKQVSYRPPEFYAVNLDNYQLAMDTINARQIKTKVQGNTVTTSYKTNKDSSIFYTIPYDKGWSASQDGKKLPLKKAQGGFMKVDIKAGEGKVILTFLPQGFIQGAILSITGILLFISYQFWLHLKKKH